MTIFREKLFYEMDKLLKCLGLSSQTKVPRYYEPRPKFFPWKKGFGENRLEGCKVSTSRKPIQELKSIALLLAGSLAVFATIAIFNNNKNFKTDFIVPMKESINLIKSPQTKVKIPLKNTLDGAE